MPETIPRPLVPDYLELWVLWWSEQYPTESDKLLDELRGLPHFTLTQMEALVAWKYPPPLTGRRLWRHDNIRNRLREHDDETVRITTSAAFAEEDDGRALTRIMALHGVGRAIGSTALMAQDPTRFTVYDTQAVKSLLALRYLDRRQQDSWTPHLDACRGIVKDTGHDLRTVDRALFMANGRLTLPATHG